MVRLTKKEAVEWWVDTFNQIPTMLLMEIAENHPYEFEEVTITDDEPDGDFPSWGTVWHFPSRIDCEWLKKNIKAVSDCGFRIFKTFYGYFIGIDGGGYDFYEYHWTPLYEARGMHWHTEEEV